MTNEPLTRAEDLAHWRKWRRNAMIGYAIMFVGFGVGGYIQNQSAQNAKDDTNAAATQFCKRLNVTSGTVAAALQQQKKLSQEKYNAGATPKAQYLQQQAALDKAIKGLAPADCTEPAVT